MRIEDNKVVNDNDQVVCSFDPETFEISYEDGVSQAQKMAVGRMLKPYKEGRKSFSEKEPEQEAESPESHASPVSVVADGMPWEVFPDCPAPGAAGDKTESVVRWVHKYHPEFYKKHYNHRMTCIDVEERETKRMWEERGAQFYVRGLKIGDCPVGASQKEREYFEEGYKKYMMSELDAQEHQDLGK